MCRKRRQAAATYSAAGPLASSIGHADRDVCCGIIQASRQAGMHA
jgi:hypothetical protein